MPDQLLNLTGSILEESSLLPPMLLVRMKRGLFACKLLIVIPLLLTAISIPITRLASAQSSINGLPLPHHNGIGNPQLPPTAGAFAVPSLHNQPNASQSFASSASTPAPHLMTNANSSRFATTTTTTTTTAPLISATGSRSAFSMPTPPAAVFNVSPSSTTTTTTSRPVETFSISTTTVGAPTSASTTMISTTLAPTTASVSTSSPTTTVGTTFASNLQDEFAPAFSTVAPDMPSMPSSPRPHNSNLELPNLENEPQPNIPHLQRQNFDEDTQHIPSNIINSNNHNELAIESRENPFDSMVPSTTTTTTTPLPSSSAMTTPRPTTPSPFQNSSLQDFMNSNPSGATLSNDQMESSNLTSANNSTISQLTPSEPRRVPDGRSRAETSNNQQSSNSSQTFRVQILKPSKLKFRCSNHTDCRNGYCIDGTCFCQPGFTGESCDINIDECRQFGLQPCLNNGTCIDDINGFRCECPAGFRGDRCQDLADMCSDSPCKNNAECKNFQTYFICECERGYKGQYCEIDIDDCAKNPCLNNATCHDQVNGYRCDCASGFMGENCETNINDCALNPCQNNATCRDLINDYECECPTGYTGKNCEENFDDCASAPCQHGACVDQLGDFKCECEEGWTGKQCDQDINECEHIRPVCANGGSCHNLEPSYKCHCREGYGGRNCNDITDYCKAKQPCKYGTCKNVNSAKVQYQCECQSGYIGNKCDRKRDCFNECHNHHAHCVSNVTCACLPGRREERIMCEYVSSCQQVDGDLCLNGGFCKNLDTGGYQCTCLEPFYGSICQFVAEKPQIDAFLFVVITCVGLLVVACAVVSLVLFRSVRKARATRGTYSPSTQEKHGNSASDLLKLPVPERLI